MCGESDKLRAALKESSSQIEKMQTEHSKEVETLHQQYNTALDKQREAVSPAAVEAEKKKARLLQEKIAELGCQMSDYERTQVLNQTRNELLSDVHFSPLFFSELFNRKVVVFFLLEGYNIKCYARSIKKWCLLYDV